MSVNNNFVNHINNLETIFYQINPNEGPYNINFKTDQSLLMSGISNSVLIPEHPHPLYSCFTPQRADTKLWYCNHCNCKYYYSVPSFYCTACDYDMCQKCMFQHPVYKIQRYIYNQKEKFILKNVNMIKKYQYYIPNIHEHIVTLIQMENYKSNNNINNNYVMHCRICKGDIKIIESFYYCSLCNYYLCKNCFYNNYEIKNYKQINQQSKQENNQLNPYLSGEQLFKKVNNPEINKSNNNQLNAYLSGDQLFNKKNIPQINNNNNNQLNDYLSGNQLFNKSNIPQINNNNNNQLNDYLSGNQLFNKSNIPQINNDNNNQLNSYLSGDQLFNNSINPQINQDNNIFDNDHP